MLQAAFKKLKLLILKFVCLLGQKSTLSPTKIIEEEEEEESIYK